MDESTEPSRRGSIGNEIFEQVEQIIKDEGLSRTNAFQRLSEQTGRRAGTVAANYYRVARMRGAPLQKRTRRAGGAARPAGRRAAGTGSVDGALSRAMESVQELAAIVRRQEKELSTLRAQLEQVEKLKSVLSKM